MKRKKFKAFTLIEMIIVLFIIGMLMMIFVPNLTKKGIDAQKKSDIAIAKVVKQEIELYKAENGEEPNEDRIVKLVGKERAEIYKKHKDEVKDEYTPTPAN
ncbi:competence type IV pilus major pilin ComGC [Enterococcus cecorum]|uniref:competence type IV pilus major pilin ComGC n=1 Tax=Enterococcus cecorum TaxID=44008 RepID=UPI00148E5B57|nr:competence type IV pilus major pilin ComGC [Enterococcus cecorum]